MADAIGLLETKQRRVTHAPDDPSLERNSWSGQQAGVRVRAEKSWGTSRT
jgi:hypothetical protein